MGYVVRHSTSNINKTRRRGKVAIGNDSDGYQKTSVSGVYNGVPPVEGKHNFVRVAQGGEPNFYATTDEELINFVNGLGERNLTTTTPSQGGWAGSYSVVDSNTRTFNLTTQQNNAATTSAWRTFYWDVSDYEGQTVAISADVEFVSETNCTFSSFTIGQGNTGQYTIHIAGSDAADKVTISTKPTSSIKMAWSGSINATGIVGFTFWINNVTTNGANSVMKVSNVQIEVNDHATDFTSPNTRVSTVLEAQNHLLERDDTVFTDNIKNNNIVTDGLVLDLNAGVKSSFLDNEPTLNYTAHQTAVTQSSYTPYSATSAGTWNTKHPKAIRAYNVDGGQITGYVNTGVTDWTNTYHAVWEYDNVLGKPVVVMDCADSNWKAKSFNPNTGQWASQGWGVGTKYVISWDQWTTHLDKSVHVGLYTKNSSESQNFWDGLSNNSTTSRNTQTQTWQRVYHVYTATSNWDQTIDYQRIYMYGQYFRNGEGVKIKIANVQLEIDRDYPSSFVKPVAGESGRSTRSQNTEWKDLSGEGNNAVLTNSPTFENNTITFDGTNDYATISSDSSFNVNTRTVEFTFKMNGSYSNFTPLAVYANGSSTSNRVWLGLQNSKFQMHGWGTTDPAATTTISADRWYTCVWSYDKGIQKMKMYTNGVLENDHSQTQGGVNGASGNNWYLAYIPGSWQSQTYAATSISSFKIYDKVLSNSEVSQNYYGGPIVTDGLVFAVDAGNLVSYENGSTIAYSMTGSHSGSLNNGTTYSNLNGGSFVFDGANDFIEIDSDVTTTNGEYTLSAWLRPNGSSWGVNSIPLYNTYGSKGFWHHIDENNVLRWRHDGSSYTVGDLSGVGLVADQWQLTTITWDNTTLKLYKNGVLQNSTTSPSGFTRSTGKPSIGKLATRTSGTLYGWNGDIALHHVYNKALTHSEVLQNYNAQKARFI
jgi:hypothetical protein